MNMPAAFDINKVVEEWRAYRKQRLELDSLSKKIKEGPEAQLRGQILMWLDSHQLPGAKTQFGTVSITNKPHLEIENTEVMLRYMFQNMVKCLQENRPLSDALILQKTPLKSGITDLVRRQLGLSENDEVTDEQFNSVAQSFGVKRVSDKDISFSQN